MRTDNMDNFEIEYFEKSNGSYPAEEFILSQNVKMRAKLLRILELLSELGYKLCEPHSRMLEDGIFEIRVQQGTDTTRVLYFFVTDKKIILTNGFVKKTQRVPKKEIAIAKKYRKEYQIRNKGL